jgi:hypothetical protein
MNTDIADPPMKIMYFCEDDATRPQYGYAIRYEGALWLVVHWIVQPTLDTLSPMRIISLARFARR